MKRFRIRRLNQTDEFLAGYKTVNVSTERRSVVGRLFQSLGHTQQTCEAISTNCGDLQVTTSSSAQVTAARTVRDRHAQLLKVLRSRLVYTVV